MSERFPGGLTESELLDAMRDARRSERIAVARRLLAAGRLCQLRVTEAGEDRSFWCVDDWESVAAEVGAELGVSRQRASSDMNYGLVLLEKLPKLGATFAAGDVDFRVIAIIVSRTALITDPDVLARIDEKLTDRAPYWNKRSDKKIAEFVDWMVIDLDPDAIRVARRSDEGRHIDMGPAGNGMADIWGNVRAPDAEAMDRRLNELADTVCADDPRTKRQRRADALAALTAGKAAMACACGSEDCPATGDTDASPGDIVIHLLAEASSVEGDGAKPAYLPGYGALPAETLTDLAKRAKLRPIVHPEDARAEPRYRPSTALADFVRSRDLTCRFPGCDCPAWMCDLDHTVPYPLGPTHASNLKCACRFHHLLKTFFVGEGGWNDLQLPDGTVIWTSPSGRTYTTKPQGALFFPQLAVPTGKLTTPTATSTPTVTTPLSAARGLAMPTRRRTRAEDRAYRVQWERAINRARYEADSPPY